MTRLAIDRIDDHCPCCHAKGFNRIWRCGSIEVAGEFEQSDECLSRVPEQEVEDE